MKCLAKINTYNTSDKSKRVIRKDEWYTCIHRIGIGFDVYNEKNFYVTNIGTLERFFYSADEVRELLINKALENS